MMLFYTKVEKFGMLTIMSVLIAIIMFVTGMGWLGAPLIIGEFGSEDKRNTAARVCHAAYFTAAARARGICCFWWDCGAFALFDRFAEKPLQPDIIRALV